MGKGLADYGRESAAPPAAGRPIFYFGSTEKAVRIYSTSETEQIGEQQ
jgi:hypothetical protein